MPSPTRKPAPAYPEIIADNTERKSKKIYRQEAVEFTDQRISEIVRGGTLELARIADGKNIVALSDIGTVKQRTLLYLRACEEASTIPTMSGLARSMGISTSAVDKYRRMHPSSETANWLELCHDAFADMMAESALKGTVQPVVAIFTLKARSGWRDTIQIEAGPLNNPLGETLSNEDLMGRYLSIDEGYDDG